MSDEPRQPQDKYILRLPDGMRERLKKEAEQNKRSLNAEIIARIEASFSLLPKLESVVEREDTLRTSIEELQADLTAFMLLQGQDPATVRDQWRQAASRMAAERAAKSGATPGSGNPSRAEEIPSGPRMPRATRKPTHH